MDSRSSSSHSDEQQPIDRSHRADQSARLNRITSLRGAGASIKIAGPAFMCASSKLADDERWTNSLLCEKFATTRSNVMNEPTFEAFLRKAADGFGAAFGQQCSARVNELYPTQLLLVDRHNKPQPFLYRKAPEPPRTVGRVSKRQPSKTVIVVDDAAPAPRARPNKQKNLVDSSVSSWGQHMESVAEQQKMSVDDMRRTHAESLRHSDDFGLLNSAREHEHNELRRLENVALKVEERKDSRKRERE